MHYIKDIEIELDTSISDNSIEVEETKKKRHNSKVDKELDNCYKDLLDFTKNSCDNTFNGYDYQSSRRKVAVFFSGGYDSTCLIIKNLEEGNEVIPIRTTFGQDFFPYQSNLVFYQLRKKIS